MADKLRFGLEMEFHGIVLTFKKRTTNNTIEFWPYSPNVPVEQTMIGSNAILVPENDTNFFLVDGNTHWESDWGFRAVGDKFGPGSMSGIEQQIGTCILELATAANVVSDYSYWMFVRQSSKVFASTMEHFRTKRLNAFEEKDGNVQWYPIADFLTEYNRRVDNLAAASEIDKTKFKLKSSPGIKALGEGTFAGKLNEHWDAYISTNAQSTIKLERFCDIQLNYQVDLEWLDVGTDNWIGLWNSMWANKVSIGAPELDPNIGVSQITSSTEVYRTQIFAALWRAAKADAEKRIQGKNVPRNAESAVTALVTYVLATGAISVEEAGGSTPKNSFPQLPKTSPASIARQIALAYPDVADPLRQLARNENILSGVTEEDMASLRNLENLTKPPGNLPDSTPQKELVVTYPLYKDNMLGGELSKHFKQMWAAALNPDHALDYGNKSGYTSAAPFYCAWAEGVKTAYPATQDENNNIKMLFESRYGTCKLNIGFNPYVRDFMFRRSYLSLVRMLAPQPDVAPAVKAVEKAIPDEPGVQQNFASGRH